MRHLKRRNIIYVLDGVDKISLLIDKVRNFQKHFMNFSVMKK